MTIIKSVLENLEWGRSFLRNSQLRSLRNLSWMPWEGIQNVLLGLDLPLIDREFIIRWLDNDSGIRGYWEYFSKEHEVIEDDYLYCYTPQLELTQLGQRMKDETYQAQARA